MKKKVLLGICIIGIIFYFFIDRKINNGVYLSTSNDEKTYFSLSLEDVFSYSLSFNAASSDLDDHSMGKYDVVGKWILLTDNRTKRVYILSIVDENTLKYENKILVLK